jgi:glycosyltransferase involved in cell wall biosynthesis
MLSNKGKSRQETPIRIGINAHLLSGESGYRRAGIHNYIDQVLDHLPLAANDCQYSIFSRHVSNLAIKPGFKLYRSQWPTERRVARIIWEQMVWPIAAARQRLDLLHSMAFVTPIITTIPSIVTVYDLSFIHYPYKFPRLQLAYLQSQTARSCRQARRVITISESGRQDVHQYFQVPLERIDVVVPGVDSLYRSLPASEVEAFRRKNGLGRQIILHVGTLQPRKNIPFLLQALAKLGRPDIDLILAGGKGWLYKDIFSKVVELGLEDQVRFTGYVPDRDLPLWYNVASMLAFPSAYEGFGLPVIEAMACGTPVVAARSSSVPEAGGTAALYYDPGDVDTLVKQMSLILDDADVAKTLHDNGKKQARRFSWERAGQETAHVYKKALGLA